MTNTALQTITSVLQARKDSISLRTTIPETYVKLLRIKLGDKLAWDHEIIDNNVVIKIKKAK